MGRGRRSGCENDAIQVAISGVTVNSRTESTERGFCSGGTCVALAQNDDGARILSATAYAATAKALPRAVVVSLSSTLRAAEPTSASTSLSYGSEASVVFANTVELRGNPLSVALSGKVSLLGTANKTGKQDTLAPGRFSGTLGVSLAGDGAVEAPPAVMLHTTGNGKGTRAVATGSNGQPGLL